MAIKKIEIISPSGDTIYPKTTASNVVVEDNYNIFTSTNVEDALREIANKTNSSWSMNFLTMGV